MRLVAARLATEIIVVGIADSVLEAEASLARPGFHESAVDDEMLLREQPAPPRLLHDVSQHLFDDLALENAIPILAEGAGIPHIGSGFKGVEPSHKEVVAQLLHQHPLTADRVQRLQQE